MPLRLTSSKDSSPLPPATSRTPPPSRSQSAPADHARAAGVAHGGAPPLAGAREAADVLLPALLLPGLGRGLRAGDEEAPKVVGEDAAVLVLAPPRPAPVLAAGGDELPGAAAHVAALQRVVREAEQAPFHLRGEPHVHVRRAPPRVLGIRYVVRDVAGVDLALVLAVPLEEGARAAGVGPPVLARRSPGGGEHVVADRELFLADAADHARALHHLERLGAFHGGWAGPGARRQPSGARAALGARGVSAVGPAVGSWATEGRRKKGSMGEGPLFLSFPSPDSSPTPAPPTPRSLPFRRARCGRPRPGRPPPPAPPAV